MEEKKMRTWRGINIPLAIASIWGSFLIVFFILIVISLFSPNKSSNPKIQIKLECFSSGGTEYREIHESNGLIRSECLYEPPPKYRM